MKNAWPVVGRELRVASRRPATWRARSSVAGLAVGLTAFILWTAMAMPRAQVSGAAFSGAALSKGAVFTIKMGNSISPGALGGVVFLQLTFVTGLAALFIGPGLTGDCISRERREGTLGLLFLTDLGGWDVVLGKLAAAAANAGYCLMGVLPVLAMPVLLGGVTLGQVALLAVALINALFVGLAAGMLASSYCRDARQATGLAYSAVVFLAAFPWATFIWLVSRDDAITAVQAAPVLLASPFILFFQVGMQSVPTIAGGLLPPLPFQVTGRMFAAAAIAQQLAAWSMLWVVARRVRTVWQDKAAAPSQGWRSAWAAVRFGGPVRRAALRRRLLDRNPFLWLSHREIWKPYYPWMLFVGLIGGFGFGLWKAGSMWIGDFFPPAIFIAHLLLVVWIVTESAQRLCEERQSGALELLLTTPLDERGIFTGQAMGLRRLFLWPALVLLGVDLWWILGMRGEEGSESRAIPFAVSAAFFLRALSTSRWVATYLALEGRTVNAVVGGALGIGFIVPNAISGTLSYLLSLWHLLSVGVPFVPFLGMDLARVVPTLAMLVWIESAGRFARNRVSSGFREMASRPLRRAAKASWWSRLPGAWRSVGRG